MPLTWLKPGSIVLPRLPEWPAGAALRLVTFAEVKKWFPAVPVSQPKDASFLIVPHQILGASIAWTLDASRAIGSGFVPESHDCDDFADFFDLALSWMAARAGIQAAPVVGCLTVRSFHPWAGIKAGGTHALNCVLTSEGMQIVEPQNGTVCPLHAYPNRDGILYVSSL